MVFCKPVYSRHLENRAISSRTPMGERLKRFLSEYCQVMGSPVVGFSAIDLEENFRKREVRALNTLELQIWAISPSHL